MPDHSSARQYLFKVRTPVPQLGLLPGDDLLFTPDEPEPLTLLRAVPCNLGALYAAWQAGDLELYRGERRAELETFLVPRRPERGRREYGRLELMKGGAP
jgi:hypothetical protein